MTSSPGTQLMGVVMLYAVVSNFSRREAGMMFVPVLVTGLQRVENPQDLVGIAASRRGVGQDETNGLLGVNDEDGTDGERNALGVDVGSVLVVDPTRRRN